MRIKFYVDSVDPQLKYPTAKSDLYAAGLDCIQGLLMEFVLNRNDILKDLEENLKKDEFEWWGESTRIIGKKKNIKIYTPNSYNDEHALINRKQLNNILADWKLFLKNNEPIVKQY